MKKFLSILLIFVFFLQSGSRLFILASFYLNQNYIASNICINRFEEIPVCLGSCFLEMQLSENEKNQDNLPDLKVKEITLYQETNSTLIIPEIAAVSNTDYPVYTKRKVAQSYYSSVFRPPCI